jgi:hypothetical protein
LVFFIFFALAFAGAQKKKKKKQKLNAVVRSDLIFPYPARQSGRTLPKTNNIPSCVAKTFPRTHTQLASVRPMEKEAPTQAMPTLDEEMHRIHAQIVIQLHHVERTRRNGADCIDVADAMADNMATLSQINEYAGRDEIATTTAAADGSGFHEDGSHPRIADWPIAESNLYDMAAESERGFDSLMHSNPAHPDRKVTREDFARFVAWHEENGVRLPGLARDDVTTRTWFHRSLPGADMRKDVAVRRHMMRTGCGLDDAMRALEEGGIPGGGGRRWSGRARPPRALRRAVAVAFRTLRRRAGF